MTRGKATSISLIHNYRGIEFCYRGEPGTIEIGGAIATQQQADKAVAWLKVMKQFLPDERGSKGRPEPDDAFPDEGI